MKIAEKTSDPVINLALDTVEIKKQALVFVNAKRSAEKVAEDISKKSPLKNSELDKLSGSVLKVLSRPTKQCERLAFCVKRGIAFHHAGLHHKQKELVEDAFRSGAVKIICCTPTLCLSGDTHVWNGLSDLPISTLDKKAKLMVLSRDKLVNLHPLRIERLSNNSELIEISSSSGYSIKATSNHRFLVKKDKKVEFALAKDIKRKDHVATVGRIRISNYSTFSLKNFIRDLPVVDVKLDSYLFYFIGVMLGDGYSGARTNNGAMIYKGSPCIVGRDIEIFDSVKETCRKLNISCREAVSCDGVPQLILGKNKWFREFLCRCGIEKREKKHIVDKLMTASDENIISLLSGLFDTDGFVKKGRNVGFSNVSEKLIKQIQRLLLRFGIPSYLRKKPASVMKIHNKEYKTLPHFELLISQKKSIVDFYRFVGFKIKRKQDDLLKLVGKLFSNVHFIGCEKCGYKIYRDLFSGRSSSHKKWGTIKLQVIQLLGKHGELGSKEIRSLLGVCPRKKDKRLNHHYELIEKKRLGSRGTTEWIWRLNPIGRWIFDNILQRNKSFLEFFRVRECPLCRKELQWITKRGWRDSDFEGDIFWDVVRDVKICHPEEYVYDVVLPDNPENNHLFVANGFIVHNSAGMDLPAFRTIIRDVRRFTAHGMTHIPVLEFLQMAGRAGRPKYDSFGESIVICQTETDREYIIEHYLKGVPEDIYSKLAVEPVLRTYLLSLITTRIISSRDSILEFFSRTFWAHQYKDEARMARIIDKMLDLLVYWGFLQEVQEGYRATAIGKRVAELYVDPLTAFNLLNRLERATHIKLKSISFLHAVSNTLEMRPLLRVKQKEFEEVEQKYALLESYLLEHEPSMFEPEYDDWLNSLKTGFMLDDWIDEKDEEWIMEHYDSRPGETRVKIDNADWLLYACNELARLMQYQPLLKEIMKVRLRLKYGVREELLPLIRLEGIGRVRARKLFRAGIKDLGDIRKVPVEKLTDILGVAVAKSVKVQVGADAPFGAVQHG